MHRDDVRCSSTMTFALQQIFDNFSLPLLVCFTCHADSSGAAEIATGHPRAPSLLLLLSVKMSFNDLEQGFGSSDSRAARLGRSPLNGMEHSEE